MNPETRAAAARDLINIASSLLRDLNGDRGLKGAGVDAGCGPGDAMPEMQIIRGGVTLRRKSVPRREELFTGAARVPVAS